MKQFICTVCETPCIEEGRDEEEVTTEQMKWSPTCEGFMKWRTPTKKEIEQADKEGKE